MNNNLIIEKITRVTVDGEVEELKFQKGVNLLVGDPNTGKTIWLQIFDYLLGDSSTVDDAFGKDTSKENYSVTDKYKLAFADLKIGEYDLRIERSWQEYGKKTKVKVNDELLDESAFSKFIFEKLGIPSLHYPKGNPYSGQTWPELSFRNLLRHIYRQENYWNELVERQPKRDQFATLCLILNIAEKLFPDEYGELVSARQKKIRLEARKAHFQDMLDDFVKKMSPAKEGVTIASKKNIENKIEELSLRIEKIQSAKQEIIQNGFRSIVDQNDLDFNLYTSLTDSRIKHLEGLDRVQKEKERLELRTAKLGDISQKIEREVKRLNRTRDAGKSLSDLKITNCPACDQEIEERKTDQDHCFLCHQHIDSNNTSIINRLDFELEQIKSEKIEIQELQALIDKEISECVVEHNSISESLRSINIKLEPIKNEVTSLVNNKISSLDLEMGQLEEKIENFKRLLPNLKDKDNLVKNIDHLTKKISRLEIKIDNLSSDIKFEEKATVLEEGMNEYINELNKNGNIWNLGSIRFQLSDTTFEFYVGKKRWTSLSNTFQAYFYFAYHYGLMYLSDKEGFSYPGLLIVDFPIEFGKKEQISGYENYLIEPFLKLSESLNCDSQMIFAGRSLDLDGANIIPMNHQWK